MTEMPYNVIQRKKIYGYDFEVYAKIRSGAWWCVTFVDYDNRDNRITIVNNIPELYEFYEQNKDAIFVGYNSRFYDSVIFKALLAYMDVANVNNQLIQFQKKEYQVLNYKTRKKFQLNNYDIIQKDKSLKQLEAYMGYEIKETDGPFDQEEDLTEEQIKEIIKYNIHDVVMALKVLDNVLDDFNAQLDIIDMYNLDAN